MKDFDPDLTISGFGFYVELMLEDETVEFLKIFIEWLNSNIKQLKSLAEKGRVKK